MLQDILPHRFHNEYKSAQANGKSKIFHFQGREVYIARDEQDHLRLPCLEDLPASYADEKLQYLFSIDDEAYFLLNSEEALVEQENYRYETVRTLRQMISKEICFAVMTAYHLYMWYRDNQYCGRCAAKTAHDAKERMMRCPKCGNMIFPRNTENGK